MTRIQCLWKDSISSSSSSCSSCRNCVANLLTTQIWDLKVNAKFSRFKTLDFKTQLNVFEQFLTCAQESCDRMFRQSKTIVGFYKRLEWLASNRLSQMTSNCLYLTIHFCHWLSIVIHCRLRVRLGVPVRLSFTFDCDSLSIHIPLPISV